MRLWPRSRAREQIREQTAQAHEAVRQSKAHRRRVDGAQAKVDHMVGLLGFYSNRNGFADAFEQMIVDRGGDREAGG